MRIAKIITIIYIITCVRIELRAQIGNSCFNSFSSITYALGVNPVSICSGDFNNDGKEDVATINSNVPNISVFLGTGTGSFGAATNFTFTPSVQTSHGSIVSEDFNHDNFKDLAIGYLNNIFVMKGTGVGSFVLDTSYILGTNSTVVMKLEIMDYNKDGFKDLAMITNLNTKFLLGSSSGKFLSPINTYGNNPSDFSIIDGNRDGYLDWIVSNTNANYIGIYYGDSAHASTPIATAGIILHAATLISAGDYNSDSYIDIAATSHTTVDSLFVFYGDSAGTFTKKRIDALGSNPSSLRSADVNMDGVTDLICGHQNSLSMWIYYGKVSGIDTIATIYSGSGVNEVAFADFNSDGKTDIVTANNLSNSISLLLENTFGELNSPRAYQKKGAYGGSFSQLQVTCNLNHDIWEDVVMTNSTSVAVLIGKGNGELLPVVTYTIPSNPLGIDVADFNNDGNSDVVISYSNRVTILLGNGSNAFSGQMNYTTTFGGDVACADFNEDGKMDIVIGNINNLGFFLGDGNGSFTSYDIMNGNAKQIIVGDFNNDGHQDYVGGDIIMSAIMGNGTGIFSNLSGAGGGGMGTTIISLTKGDYNGDLIEDVALIDYSGQIYTAKYDPALTYFTMISSFPTVSGSGYSRGITTNDFNKDGIADIASANNDSVIIFVGLGNGVFNRSSSFESNSTPFISSKDMNGDSLPDILIQSYYYDGINIILNAASRISATSSLTFCPGGSAILSGPINAGIYHWYPGNISTQSYTVTSSGTYSLTVTGLNNFCAATTSTIQVKTMPEIIVIGNTSPCYGSSTSLIASGANTYTWSTGAQTATVTVPPSTAGVYTVAASDISCTNTQTVQVTVNTTCADVWPGDVNSDGMADNLDILELGLHYTQTGPARSSVNNSWQSYHASNWAGTISNGQNLNHSDCNGDGTIDNNDTLAIYTSYGLNHAFKPVSTTTVNPQLSIVPDQAMVNKGQWGTASIYLGSSATPVNNINGIAFGVEFDHTLIEPSSIWLEYPISFINSTNQNLHFRKPNYANDIFYTATTHTISNNVSGNGKIAILHYQIKNTLVHDTVLNIGLTQANKSDALGTISPLTSGTASLTAIGASVGVQELIQNPLIAIYPNPAKDYIIISGTQPYTRVELKDITGRILIVDSSYTTKLTLPVDELTNGVYFIEVYSQNSAVKRQKMVIQK